MKNHWLEKRKAISVKASPSQVVINLYEQWLDAMHMTGEPLTEKDKWCFRSELLFNYADVLPIHPGMNFEIAGDESLFYKTLSGVR